MNYGQKEKMHEELEEIAEKFACMPQIVQYLQGLEREIRYYNCYEWGEGVTKERLLQKQQTLVRLIGEIDCVDLYILFYLREIRAGNRYKLRKALKEQYEAECKFEKEIYQMQEKFDICSIGNGCVHKLRRAREKKH